MKAIAIILAALAAGSPPAAMAMEAFHACVTIVAAGKSYRLQPLIDTGEGLNTLTGGLARLDPEAIYVVVPWSNGAESIIRMENGPPTPEGAPGVDLEGNNWIVSTDPESCP